MLKTHGDAHTVEVLLVYVPRSNGYEDGLADGTIDTCVLDVFDVEERVVHWVRTLHKGQVKNILLPLVIPLFIPLNNSIFQLAYSVKITVYLLAGTDKEESFGPVFVVVQGCHL